MMKRTEIQAWGKQASLAIRHRRPPRLVLGLKSNKYVGDGEPEQRSACRGLIIDKSREVQ